MQDRDPTQMDIVRSLRHLPLPMPKDLAEVFQLLGLYDPRDGLEHLISRVNLTGVQPKQIYNAVLGRAPDDIATAVPGGAYDAAKRFREALQSREFQVKAIRNILRIFSEKKRDIFIHVPKCAGTDLILNMAPNRLSLPRVLDFEEWVSKEDFFASISGLIQAAPYYDKIFFYGHIQVGEYFDLAGLRQSDNIFTVIRRPEELLLSQANYAVARLTQDPAGLHFDTRETLTALGLESVPKEMGPAELKDLACRCLLNPRISQPDRICYYLGKDYVPSYRRAIEQIVTFDIEVTDTSHYQQWLSERWGIGAGSRHNESTKVLTVQEARRFFPDELQAATMEDQKLFNVIEWALKQSGCSSIRGRDLAEMAGAELLGDLPERLEREKSRPAPTMIVVQDDEFIPQFDAPVPEQLTRYKRTVAAEYRLCLGGNGEEITKDGWATPEIEFTWTNANRAQFELPTPTKSGLYVIRVSCRPFVIDDILLRQRVIVLLNDRKIGAAAVKEKAIIECDFELLDDDDRGPLKITLELPEAAAPVALGQSDDERFLGLAVVSITLLRISLDSESETPILPRDKLLLAFESLGENCEFGLVQRRCDAEPLGLFRFSSAPLPRLLKGLRAKFKGMGRPENLEVQLSSNGREYMVLDKRFGFLYHAWVLLGEKEPDEIALRESRRLPLLIRKLIEDITLGEKIFVYHGMDALNLAQIRELFAALRSYGPATLLWVELADEAHEAGTVEQIEPGLLKGYMDRFAPGENAHDLSLGCWIEVCRKAYAIWKPT